MKNHTGMTMHDSIQDFLAHCKSRITETIMEAFSAFEQQSNDSLNAVSKLAGERLKNFMKGGKMIRGALVRLGAELFSTHVPDACIDWAGAAMEFFQAGLLIHDDIMDRDTVRRGSTTIHWQYVQDAMQHTIHENGYPDGERTGAVTTLINSQGAQDYIHYGESAGICLGDFAFFLGNYALQKSMSAVYENYTHVANSDDAPDNPLAFTALELCNVGIAQMLDVQYGTAFFETDPSIDDIITVYRYKTGRYTFSLPLSVGARLGGAPGHICRTLETYGEQLGIVFQLKDDELGIFAPAEKLGKVSGADIKENKKTVHRKILFEQPDLPDSIKELFGKENITCDEIDAVREAMRRYAVDERVRAIMAEYMERARLIRKIMNFKDSNASRWLLQLENYSLVREF
ncbi:MAG TPA: polyprenyl synthetase family protein [Spirochaetales bacterium]|mgnify:FL=1|nr:polyprenyl synthetase family protein [Spirochaetales bacterium]HPD80538.1 polyprenyl synthetase family protein [Spirochaetales bacterium]HQK34281.1 polyprenyl synthetase family protein [Spirochaetales bacterium]HRV27619.1 polyprenyl synthetase family protein [Spirochaetia bacterium]